MALMRIAALACVLLLAAPGLAAGPAVQTKLIANADTLAPGESVTLGILVQIPRGWHIYWKDPGDAGVATQVKWKLPRGWSAQELQYPLPMQFRDASLGSTTFGYEDEVMLTAQIKVPADAKVGTTAQIGAEVTWLCCQNVCVMGNAALTLSLPIGAERKEANEDLFTKWAQRMPVAADGLDSPVRTWNADEWLNDGTVRVVVDWKAAVSDVEFFPEGGDRIIVRKVKIRQEEQRSVIDVTLDLSHQERRAGMHVNAVIAGLTNGKRQAINVDIPLSGSAGITPGH